MFQPDRSLQLPRDHGETGGMFFRDLPQESGFVLFSGNQDRIRDRKGREGLVDHPGKRVDLRAFQILLEFRRLVHGSGFWQGDDQDSGETGITKSWEQILHRLGHSTSLSRNFAVIGKSGIEQ